MPPFASSEARADQVAHNIREADVAALQVKERFHSFVLQDPALHATPSAWHFSSCRRFRITPSTAFLETFNQIIEESDHRENELVNEDFRSFRTSPPGGSLHVIRSSRPRRMSGKIERRAETVPDSPPMDFSLSPSFQNLSSWCASRWKSSSHVTPSIQT